MLHLFAGIVALQKNVRTEFHQAKLEMKKKKFLERIQQTARAEILNSEDAGLDILIRISY